ncbi:CVNH domain-containing protein [Biscogniauxia marginata]|nr:CVNH domain-containing protein [Biscogniauxia marginata]
MFFLTTIVALVSSFASVVTTRPTLPAPGHEDSFETTCNKWKIKQEDGNAWLEAYCHDNDGLLWHSVINLNHCIANDFGHLIGRAEGIFANSCSDMKIGADTTLNAQCAGGDDSRGSIRLSDILSNDNGQLYCFGIRGCAVDDSRCTDKPARK